MHHNQQQGPQGQQERQYQQQDELNELRINLALTKAQTQWMEKADKKYASKIVEKIVFWTIGTLAASILGCLVLLFFNKNGGQ